MIFKHAVPILYSSNVVRSLTYYKEVLGFDRSWDWGNPPTFGGVIKDSVEIFFCENGQGNPGTWLIGLHSGEHLADFYRQFGFAPAFGMYRLITAGS